MSAPFVRFALDVKNYCQTLPQLLYHKDRVVELLIKNLNDGNVLALEPILDLTTQLSKDLDDELFPYFDRLLTAILPLVEFRDVKVIEVSIPDRFSPGIIRTVSIRNKSAMYSSTLPLLF